MGDRRRGAGRSSGSVLLLAGALATLGLGGCASGLGGIAGQGAPLRIGASALGSLNRLPRSLAGTSSNAEPHRPTLAEKLHEGDASRDAGEPGRALWSYLQAHKIDRNAPEPVARIAALHLKDDPERAREIFLRLSERHPDSASAYTGLGLAELAGNEPEKARAALLRAVELDPSGPVALSALGITLDQMGRHAEAQEHHLKAVALAPDVYQTLNNLGVSYLMTESHEQAVEILRRAVVLEPRDPAVRNNLGLALGRLGRYDEALVAFHKAGAEPAALNNLGYVYFLNGRYADAIVQYEQALMLGGENRLEILRNLRKAREAAAGRH